MRQNHAGNVRYRRQLALLACAFTSSASAGWVTLTDDGLTAGATAVKSGCVAPGQYERPTVPLARSVTIQGLPDSGKCYFALNAGPQDEWVADFTALRFGRGLPGPVGNLGITWKPSPAGSSSRYLRWTITKRRGVQDSVQVDELEVLNGSTVVSLAAAVVTNPGGNGPANETAPNLVRAGKWLDWNFSTIGGTVGRSVVLIDRGSSAASFTGYRYRTANDYPERDPVSWTLERSADGVAYVVIDTRTDQSIPTARGAFTAVMVTQ